MVPPGPLKTSAPKVSFVTQRYLVHILQQKPLIQGGAPHVGNDPAPQRLAQPCDPHLQFHP